ncbi:MAG: hypothetical protein LBH22_06395 [Bacteroidales bacterium]|jgi:hypothetical protein|nr:hypothetical protein [Bacteroidales bacterium]
METVSLIIAIIGLGIGLPSVIIFFRQKNTKLIYVERSQISIQEDFLKNFNDLSIKYKDTKISSNLIFVRGYIICDGSKDICTESNQIQIKSQEKTKWIDFKIISKSEGLEVSYDSNNNIANINFDLLKSGEYLEFEGFVELIEPIEDYKVNLTFFHRIANIKAIEKLNTVRLKDKLSTPIFTMMLSLFFLVIILVEFDLHNINIYDSETNELISCSHLENSDDFETLLSQLKDEKINFYSLMTKKPEIYTVKYDRYDERDDHMQKLEVEKNVYLKVNIGFSEILIIIFALITIVIFIRGAYSAIYYFTRKKYLLQPTRN